MEAMLLASAAMLAVPLHFEPNVGQADTAVRYVARDAAGTFYFADDQVVVGDVQLRLSGANPHAAIETEDALPGRSNYLRGADRSRWHRGVAQFARLRYRAVYPGIDVVYYGAQNQIEHDFVVAPGADPRAIELRIAGASSAGLDDKGDLRIATSAGTLTLHHPTAYQDAAGARRAISAAFRVGKHDDETTIAFDLGDYDASRQLVIDPIVTWSTLIGSSRDDEINGMAVDSAGNAYIIGYARWFDWPLVGALQPEYGDGTSLSKQGGYDAVVTKFAPDGTLVYSTYLGGNSTDLGYAIAVDSAGSAHVAGYTASSDFPVAGLSRPRNGVGDAFVAKLTSDGSALIYSTYLGGGTGFDNALAIAADSAGNTLVGGNSWSYDFPTLNALQPAFAGGNSDAFLAKLSGTTGRLLYSTYLGGASDESIGAITLTPAGNPVVTGWTASDDFPTLNALQPSRAGGSDGFVARFATSGKSLVFSTYLGGTRDERLEAIAIDAATGGIYVGGGSNSPDFPLVKPLQGYAGAAGGYPHRDAIVANLRYDGAILKFATYLGGADEDYVRGIAVDADQNVYIGGTTYSADFPQVAPFQAFGGSFDGFVAKLKPGTLLMSSPLGGPGYDLMNAFGVDGAGNLYAAGRTSGGYPTVNAYQPVPKNWHYYDAFVTKISQTGTAVPDVIELHLDTYGVVENQGSRAIRLDRTGSGYGTVSVRFTTADGTATQWDDYLPVDGGVQWTNGQLGPKYVGIVVNDDGKAEGPETVNLSITSPHGFAVLGSRTTATLRIRDP